MTGSKRILAPHDRARHRARRMCRRRHRRGRARRRAGDPRGDGRARAASELPSIVGMPRAGEHAGGRRLRRRRRDRGIPRRPAGRPGRSSIDGRRGFRGLDRAARRCRLSASCASARRRSTAAARAPPTLPHIRLDRALAIPARGPPRMTIAQRRPAAFRLDDPQVVVDAARHGGRAPARRRHSHRAVTAARRVPALSRAMPPGRAAPLSPGAPCSGRRSAASSCSALGLAVTQLIEDLFARADRRSAVSALALAAACRPRARSAILARETPGSLRLAAVEKLARARRARHRQRRPRRGARAWCASSSRSSAPSRGLPAARARAAGASRRDHRWRRPGASRRARADGAAR